MVTVGRNSTGATLYKGTIVYISGSTGNRPNFVKSQANAESTSAGTFGVIESDIPNNSDGNCVTIGTIENLDTRSTATHPFTNDTLLDGDTIYLSPTTAGFVTKVKPSAPNHMVYVGKVVRTSPTNGTIVYRIQNGYELDEIHDVTTTNYSTPQDVDSLLILDNSTSLWKRLTWANLKATAKTYFDTIYQTIIPAGTTSQYFRGDKTFQTLDKTAVGLSNVDNTSDANKPVSTAQAIAINAKQDLLGFTPENVANKSVSVVADKASDTKYPSVKSVWDWVVSAFQPLLVSGTSIKTINGSSVLGSGDLAISGGGASGIHTMLLGGGSLFGGIETTNSVSVFNATTYTSQDQMLYFPYIPNNSFTATTFTFQVNNTTVGGLARLCIYSHNGINAPLNRLYQSTDISLATSGSKTISVSYSFVKGTVYWFGLQTNIFNSQITGMNSNGGVLPIGNIGTTQVAAWVQVSLTYASGAPATAAPNSYSSTIPLIRLK